ncbi:TniB family NTP-binding protein [Frigoribacterium sp. Leaf172]|uniref:TniB family NTP-binding protein n=1 Tax=Frigoribacterium sp. Leaf172 TaxID=1736285 RepID=UPI00138EEAAE|nr:TniB family NTP-binding protein [Frigoribacterium sp. Leaf172]
MLTDEHNRLVDALNSHVNTNRDMAGQRLGFWVDAESSTGKTTSVMEWAHGFYRNRVQELVDETGSDLWNGNVYVPFACMTLSERPTPRTINQDLSHFFPGPPATRSLTSAEYAINAIRLMEKCGTEVLLIDDAHSLANRWGNTDATSLHLKYLMSRSKVTLVLVSADDRKRARLMEEGVETVDYDGQLKHRFVPYKMNRFQKGTPQWRKAVASIAVRMALSEFDRDAFVARRDLLFDLSGGFLGSIWLIVRLAAERAIRTGIEDLTEPLLLQVHRDWSATERYTPPLGGRAV